MQDAGRKKGSAGQAAPEKPHRCPIWESRERGTTRQAGYAWTKQAGRVAGSSLHAWLRYRSCPEGNREPWKGLEQGVHRGRVAMHDLSASLLLGHGQTASSTANVGLQLPSTAVRLPTPRACRLLVYFL